MIVAGKTISLYAPFSSLLILADFYAFTLVAYVYLYQKRSLTDYLPAPDEYELP